MEKYFLVLLIIVVFFCPGGARVRMEMSVLGARKAKAKERKGKIGLTSLCDSKLPWKNLSRGLGLLLFLVLAFSSHFI